MTLIITDLNTFTTSSGSGVVPVRKFAGFYVTGWDISSQTDGCPDNDPHPDGAGPADDNGDVWGHFITEVKFVPGGTESEDFCVFSEIGLCTAVLTE